MKASPYLGISHWVNKQIEEVMAVLKHLSDGDLGFRWPQSAPLPVSWRFFQQKRKIKARSQPGAAGEGALLWVMFAFLSGDTLWVRPPWSWLWFLLGMVMPWVRVSLVMVMPQMMVCTGDGDAAGKGITGDSDGAGEGPAGDGNAAGEGLIRDRDTMGKGPVGDGDAAGKSPTGNGDAVGEGPAGDPAGPGNASCCWDAGPRLSPPCEAPAPGRFPKPSQMTALFTKAGRKERP